ncbi:MAG: hypothetical protein U0Y68_13350 [Blastocatellia bacterium]
MARHSEEECAYCEGDVLPLSYIVGEDDELYCSIKCADAGEKRWREQAPRITREVRVNLSVT